MNAEAGQERIEQSRVRIENPEPENARGHRRNDRRQIKKRAPNGDPANLEIEEERDPEAERHAQRNPDDHVSGVADRFPEEPVTRKHPLVVCQSHEAGRIKNVVIAKADDDGKKNRPAGKNNETYDPGRSAKPAAAPLRPKVTAARAFKGRGPAARRPGLPIVNVSRGQREKRQIYRNEIFPRDKRTRAAGEGRGRAGAARFDSPHRARLAAKACER